MQEVYCGHGKMSNEGYNRFIIFLWYVIFQFKSKI